MLRLAPWLCCAVVLACACNNGGGGSGGGGGSNGGGQGGGGGGQNMLALNVSINGPGTVSSSPGGILCPSQCAHTFPSGTAVTLVSNAQAGATFSGWSGDCAGTGPSCIVTVDQTRNVTANFTGANTHTLTVMVTGPGNVSDSATGFNCGGGSCTQAYPSGTMVTLQAMPQSNASFNGWSGACSGTGGCTVDLGADVTVSADFMSGNTNNYTLTVNLAGDGVGTVTSTPAGIDCTTGSDAGCSHDFGTFTGGVSLTVAPASGSEFGGWSFGGCSGSGYTHTCPVAISMGGTAVTVYFSGWSPTFPFPADVTGFTTSNGQVIAVGDEAAVASADGGSWTGHPVTGVSFGAVAVDPGSGVMVGVGKGGVIESSADQGQSWVARTSPVTTDLDGVAFLPPSTFVAVGSGGHVLTAASSALDTWSAATSNTTNDLHAVAWSSAHSLAVAVGLAGTILTSPDGTSWTVRTASPLTTQILEAVSDGPSGLVAVGTGGAVVSSTDGVNWGAETPPTTVALRAVTASGSGYVAAGDALNSGPVTDVVLTSPDGASWTTTSTGAWSESGRSLGWFGGTFYWGGTSGSVMTSTDGSSWTYVLGPGGRGAPGMGAQTTLGAVGYGGGTYVAAGGSVNSIFSSPDGMTWTSRRVAPCCQPGGVASFAYGNGRFAAVGGNGSGWQVLTSPDAVTWTVAQTGGAPTQASYLASVLYAGGRFVAVGSNFDGNTYGAVVVTSPDGITWTEQTNSGATYPLHALAYDGTTYVAGGTTQSGMGSTIVLYSSPDGATWTLRSNTISGYDISSLAYGNSKFVGLVSQPSPGVVTSPDGMSWTYTGQSQQLGYALAFGQGTFRTDRFFTSTDGTTWSSLGTPETGTLSQLMFDGSSWIGVGYAESFWRHL